MLRDLVTDDQSSIMIILFLRATFLGFRLSYIGVRLPWYPCFGLRVIWLQKSAYMGTVHGNHRTGKNFQVQSARSG